MEKGSTQTGQEVVTEKESESTAKQIKIQKVRLKPSGFFEVPKKKIVKPPPKHILPKIESKVSPSRKTRITKKGRKGKDIKDSNNLRMCFPELRE